ncbi:hypothetical protein BDV96DRAFT_219533 [Lophiotrema nucula]|uniref:Uncharacterized protein n=1 Tax=Lophiotrema nucula TaxID=690887 RepID=A0A6A5YS89_9PLEO|nr:hypothetical protein BDV96DRAFT_219533 [Lophiotrema nucula]
MAPIRRYLRITKHSVLEVRIYLDRPSDADAWLLRRENPALPRVIQAVRPLVLPKLREENERAKGRGSKARKKGVKDVVAEDDFEVSIFLTEHSSRHSVLTKQKIFKDKPRIQSNSSKLTNWLTTGTSDQPFVVAEDSTEPLVIREEDDEHINMIDIPEATKSSKSRRRGRRAGNEPYESEQDDSDDSIEFDTALPPKQSRQNDGQTAAKSSEDEEARDDKKTLGMNTSYDGFSIYGRILCLVVKRKGVRSTVGGSSAPMSSQQMLENWVSTQAAAEQINDEDDNS